MTELLEVTTKEMIEGMKNSQTVYYALSGKKKPCFMAFGPKMSFYLLFQPCKPSTKLIWTQ